MSAVEFESRGSLPAATDLRINIANLRQAVKTIVARSKAGRGYTFFTFNLDHLVKLDQDRRFSEAYDRADFVTADGWPIVWRVGQTLERTTGADLLEPVCAQAAAHDIPLYFVGPSPRSQATALKSCARAIPLSRSSGRRRPIFPRASARTSWTRSPSASTLRARACACSRSARPNRNCWPTRCTSAARKSVFSVSARRSISSPAIHCARRCGCSGRVSNGLGGLRARRAACPADISNAPSPCSSLPVRPCSREVSSSPWSSRMTPRR